VSKRPFMNVLVLSAALVIGAGPYVVRAAGFRGNAYHAEPGAVANIDMQRVYSESDARKGAEEKVRDFGIKLGGHFDEIAKLEYLNPGEISDYSVALNTEKPTPEMTKKITDLKAASVARTDEYSALTGKKDADLTQKDRDRMRELTNYRNQRPEVLARLQKIYQAAVDEEEAKQNRAGMAEVRAVVGKLAKDQGFSQVYDASSLVYAPVDLTDQALKKTQTKKKP
jgi:Skp family chaperone for outer membrane proteins